MLLKWVGKLWRRSFLRSLLSDLTSQLQVQELLPSFTLTFPGLLPLQQPPGTPFPLAFSCTDLHCPLPNCQVCGASNSLKWNKSARKHFLSTWSVTIKVLLVTFCGNLVYSFILKDSSVNPWWIGAHL